MGRLLLVIACATVIAMTAWVAGQGTTNASRLTRDYTERLASGHSDLATPPDPRLLALADPYDPAANAGFRLLDASLHGGRYYLYFGVTPFVSLLVPWFWATGRHLPEAWAILVYGLGAWACFAWALVFLRARYFATASWLSLANWVLAFGFSAQTFLLLRRPEIYEVVIAAGLFHVGLAVLATTFALTSPTRRNLWLAVAAASLGAAVGARPHLVFIVPALLWCGWESARKSGQNGAARNALLSMLLPLGIIGGSLAWFNVVRFGVPWEFGFTFQLADGHRTQDGTFGTRYALSNLFRWLFGGARLSPYFPFVLGEASGPFPAAATIAGSDQVYGILWMVPGIALLALAAFRRGETPRSLLVLLAAAGAVPLLVLTFGTMSAYRYGAEVVPPLITLAAITAMAWEHGLAGRAARIALRGFVAMATLATVLVAFCLQAALYGIWGGQDPAGFAKAERAFNAPVFFYERLRGDWLPRAYEVELTLPSKRVGQVEPLLVTGPAGRQDFLYLHYSAPGRLRVGFESMGRGGPVSEEFAAVYDVPIVLRVQLGSWLPPDGHPLLAALSEPEIAVLRAHLIVEVDGEAALSQAAQFHPPRGLFHWGASPDDAAFGRGFTGELKHITPVPLTLTIPRAAPHRER